MTVGEAEAPPQSGILTAQSEESVSGILTPCNFGSEIVYIGPNNGQANEFITIMMRRGPWDSKNYQC